MLSNNKKLIAVINKAGLINARSEASVAQIELELILADGSTFPQKKKSRAVLLERTC